MKWLMLLCACLLTGCAAEETLETVNDEWVVPVMAQPRQVHVRLPEDAVVPVLEQEGSALYMARDYEIAVETLSSGDLDATIRSLTGYDSDRLTVIRTCQDELRRYDFVWTAAGEEGERLGRGVILDDGNYHYCLSALHSGKEDRALWQEVFSSFCLS